MSGKVAIISQPDYEPSSLRKSIQRAIESSGFDLNSVSGKKVLLKPNVLGAFPPRMAVTTHPSFFTAVALLFKEAGAIVSAGDSPDGVYMPDWSWRATGLGEACKKAGIGEAQFEASGSVEREGLMIARAVIDADMVINIPKFKTHSLTVLTLAVKNLYGCVNGMLKVHYHKTHSDRVKFAELLVRIADCIKPDLSIIDGIIAMEGNGPSAGKLRKLGVVVAGTNVHAVDAACCRLIDIDPLEVSTLAAAKKMGLWDDAAPIEIVGDPLEGMCTEHFELPMTHRRGLLEWGISKFILRRIFLDLSCQPRIDKRMCEKCMLCVNACPVKAIRIGDDESFPIIDTNKCVQCFCCHETCPHLAIDIRRNLRTTLGRWISLIRTRI